MKGSSSLIALSDDAWERSDSCTNSPEAKNTGLRIKSPSKPSTEACGNDNEGKRGRCPHIVVGQMLTDSPPEQYQDSLTHPGKKSIGHEIRRRRTTSKGKENTGNKSTAGSGSGTQPGDYCVLGSAKCASDNSQTPRRQNIEDPPLIDLKTSLDLELGMQSSKDKQAKDIQQWLTEEDTSENLGKNKSLDMLLHTTSHIRANTSTAYESGPDDKLKVARAHTHTFLERVGPHMLVNATTVSNTVTNNTYVDEGSKSSDTRAVEPEVSDLPSAADASMADDSHPPPELRNRKTKRQPSKRLERKRSGKRRGQTQSMSETTQVQSNAPYEPIEVKERSQFADIFEWNAELPEVEGENSPEKLLSIIVGPIEMEKLVWRGCLMFQDGLLYCVTILPIRFCFSLLSGLSAILSRNPVSPRHIHDTVQGIIIIVSVHLIDFLDIDEAYHVVLHLSWTRTWVLYNLFDVCDIILTAIGRRVMGSLMWSIRNKSWYIPLMTAIACLYVTLHSFAMTLKLATLHVAIDRGQLLFALLLAIKMPEFKGGNFTGMTKEDLLNTCLNDMVDRSKAMVFSLLIFMHKALRWRTHQPSEWVPAIASATLMVLGVEVLVDVIKHVAILTFNLGVLSQTEYYKLSLDLAKDLLQWTNKNSWSGLGDCTVSLLSDRFGYVTVPLTCILLRVCRRAVTIYGISWTSIMFLMFLPLLIAKLWTRWYLIKTSYWMVRAEKLSNRQSVSDISQIATETVVHTQVGAGGTAETRVKEAQVYTGRQDKVTSVNTENNNLNNIESSYGIDKAVKLTRQPDRALKHKVSDGITCDAELGSYAEGATQTPSISEGARRYQLRACQSAPYQIEAGDVSDILSSTDSDSDSLVFTSANLGSGMSLRSEMSNTSLKDDGHRDESGRNSRNRSTKRNVTIGQHEQYLTTMQRIGSEGSSTSDRRYIGISTVRKRTSLSAAARSEVASSSLGPTSVPIAQRGLCGHAYYSANCKRCRVARYWSARIPPTLRSPGRCVRSPSTGEIT